MKRGRGRDVFKQGLPQPTSDNNLTVHAPTERKHPIACPTDVFYMW